MDFHAELPDLGLLCLKSVKRHLIEVKGFILSQAVNSMHIKCE